MSNSQTIRQSESPIRRPTESSESSENRIAYTIEFYPEEGKYHYTGHRNCQIVQSPQETKEKGTKCPVCGRTLTVGVEHRVGELAQKTQNTQKISHSDISDGQIVRNTGSSELSGSSENWKEVVDTCGVTWIHSQQDKRPHYVSLVPLLEIIKEALGSSDTSSKVRDLYWQMTKSLGSEFAILLKASLSDIAQKAGSRVAGGIKKVRERNIVVVPGYDGVYEVVKIWSEEEKQIGSKKQVVVEKDQLGLF